jgi:hypothetical protein
MLVSRCDISSCADLLRGGIDMGGEKLDLVPMGSDMNGQTVRVLDNESFSRWNGLSLEYLNM